MGGKGIPYVCILELFTLSLLKITLCTTIIFGMIEYKAIIVIWPPKLKVDLIFCRLPDTMTIKYSHYETSNEGSTQ